MSTGSMIYVASPYSHSNPRTQEERFHQVSIATAVVAKDGFTPYSPIMHWHPIDSALGGSFLSHERYLEMDCQMIDLAREVWVYIVSGFSTSKGVTREVEYARSQGKLVRWFRLDHKGSVEFVEESEVLKYDDAS